MSDEASERHLNHSCTKRKRPDGSEAKNDPENGEKRSRGCGASNASFQAEEPKYRDAAGSKPPLSDGSDIQHDSLEVAHHPSRSGNADQQDQVKLPAVEESDLSHEAGHHAQLACMMENAPPDDTLAIQGDGGAEKSTSSPNILASVANKFGTASIGPGEAVIASIMDVEHPEQNDVVVESAARISSTDHDVYSEVTKNLRARIERAEGEGGVAGWRCLKDYLGEGVRSRLEVLASLYLSCPGNSEWPEYLLKMSANSNRIMMGIPPNCELYQERVIRALARYAKAAVLVVDSAELLLDDLEHESSKPGKNRRSASRYLEDDEEALFDGMSTSDTEEDDMDALPALRKTNGARGRMERLNHPRKSNRNPVLSANASEREKFMKSILAAAVARASEAKAKASEAAAAISQQKDALEKYKCELLKLEKKELKGFGKSIEPQDRKKKRKPDNAAAKPDRKKTDTAKILASKEKATVPMVDDEEPNSKVHEEDGGVRTEEATKNSERDDAVEGPRAVMKSVDTSHCKASDDETKPSSAVGVKPVEKDDVLQPAYSSSFDHKVSVAPDIIDPQALEDLRARHPQSLSSLVKEESQVEEECVVWNDEEVDDGTPDLKDRADLGDLATVKNGTKIRYAGLFKNTPDGVKPIWGATMSTIVDSVLRSLKSRNPGKTMTRSLALHQLKRDYRKLGRFTEGLTDVSSMIVSLLHDHSSKSCPPNGAKGKVVRASPTLVEVVFEEPWSGGKSFPGHPPKRGWLGLVDEIEVEDGHPVSELEVCKEDRWSMSFRALFDVIAEAEKEGPVVVLVKGMGRLLRSSKSKHWKKLRDWIERLPRRSLFIAGYVMRHHQRERASGPGPGGLGMLFMGPGSRGGGVGDLDDGFPSLIERLGNSSSSLGKSATKGKFLNALLPNRIELHPPHEDAWAKAWKDMVERDAAELRNRSNRSAILKAMDHCGMQCDDLDSVCLKDFVLTRGEIEATLGSAAVMAASSDWRQDDGKEDIRHDSVLRTDITEDVCLDRSENGASGAQELRNQIVSSRRLDQQPDALTAGDTLVERKELAKPPALEKVKVDRVQGKSFDVKACHIVSAAERVYKVRHETANPPEKLSLKDLTLDQYEKQLSTEVIPPDELGVTFDDVGALESVKCTLEEIVMLPLKRPELFTRGALTRPTKGLLLFGPPGTGKTMLAKALACEAGAHFLNVNMSSITSKWFGEGERLVKAVFSLAHKLAPSVIFVDEVDSFLSRRGAGSGHSEHEALRKMKNEFMQHWDGLRTKSSDRVLVLAATNRPMDLDEAVIRRMPRRIFIPLPDVKNREKILRVILKDEEVQNTIRLDELALLTEGYSGSDLRNLCTAAAYCPVREWLVNEKKKEIKETSSGHASSPSKSPANGEDEPPALRPISMADFEAAMKQVTRSTHGDSATMEELKRWNEQYGEGGGRRSEHLVYFT